MPQAELPVSFAVSLPLLSDMAVQSRQELFGSRRRTEVLIMLALLEETYPTELARLLDAPLYSVQTILASLEDQGIVASRKRGRMRMVSLDPRYYAFEELQALLRRMARAEPELEEAAAGRRSRPRQTTRL